MLIILHRCFLPLIINHRTSFFLTSNADITYNLSNPTVEMDPCKHRGIFLMICLITFSKEYFASICFFAQYEQPCNVSPKHQRSPASCLQQQSTADVQESFNTWVQYLQGLPRASYHLQCLTAQGHSQADAVPSYWFGVNASPRNVSM